VPVCNVELVVAVVYVNIWCTYWATCHERIRITTARVAAFRTTALRPNVNKQHYTWR